MGAGVEDKPSDHDGDLPSVKEKAEGRKSHGATLRRLGLQCKDFPLRNCHEAETAMHIHGQGFPGRL